MNRTLAPSARIAVATGLLAAALAACQPTPQNEMVGTLERDRIELKVETNEPITAIRVADGERVSAGDLVLEQDSMRALARQGEAVAARDQAAARLAELERGPRQEAIRESRAQLEGLEAVTRNEAAEYQRIRGVFEKGLASEANLDAREAAWKAASAAEQAARESLAALLNGTTPEELQQAAAALSFAEANLERARIDVARTMTQAPVAGTVDKVLFQVGERPPVGSTVAVLLDDARVFARVYVPEYLRSQVQPGDPVPVRVDGVEAALSGTVRWVSSDASFTPYFALTEHDRSRLSYLAEIDVPGAADLPSGVPVVAVLPPAGE